MIKAEFINPFFSASKDVLEQVCNISSTRSEIYAKNGLIKEKDLKITIGISGDIEGAISLNFDKVTALEIASRMMGGFEINELNEIATSAVSELCNMIAGKSGVNFAEMKKNIDITPPVVEVNGQNCVKNYEKKILCIPLALDLGKTMEIDVAIN